MNNNEIDQLVIGNIYTNNDISEAFKCSNMGGMRRSKVTNSLVLITKHQEKRAGDIYEDEWTSDGILNYTGMGTIGDQDINYAQNKTLATAKQLGINVYLFESYKDNEYYYDGEVEVCGPIFTANEKDVDGKMRQVLKFPLRKIYSDEDTIDQEVIEISNEVNVIFDKVTDNGLLPAFINAELEIRKYNNVEEKRKKIRVSKPDYISEEIVKTKNGEINEKKIFEIELEKMLELDAKEEAKKMEDFFYNRKDNEGYDILSFEQDENGNLIEKFIEVKSTKGPESTPIDITDNEINFAKEHINNYYIYRIYNSEKENNSYKILSAKDLFDKYKLIPTTYKIYM